MNTSTKFTGVLGMALVVALSASAASSETVADKYTPGEVQDGGTIVGVVTYDGVQPSPELVDVTTQESVCHADPIYSEQLVVSDDLKVKWAVVSIKAISKGKEFPTLEGEDRPKIDQNGCVFDPRVLTIQTGQSLRVLNSDGVLHNVHTWPKKNRSKNMAMPGAIKELALKFRRAERIRVTCDIHPWMEAWIVVTDHPYFAVTDKEGKFKLEDVPPGTYTLKLWHETLGEFEQEVTVESGAETTVEFHVKEQPDA